MSGSGRRWKVTFSQSIISNRGTQSVSVGPNHICPDGKADRSENTEHLKDAYYVQKHLLT